LYRGALNVDTSYQKPFRSPISPHISNPRVAEWKTLRQKNQVFHFPGPQKRTSGKRSFCFHIFNSKNTYKNYLPKLRIERISFFLLSETNFGNKLWKQILETKLGNKFWKQVLETNFGNKVKK
jgi:hypothetical protein